MPSDAVADQPTQVPQTQRTPIPRPTIPALPKWEPPSFASFKGFDSFETKGESLPKFRLGSIPEYVSTATACGGEFVVFDGRHEFEIGQTLEEPTWKPKPARWQANRAAPLPRSTRTDAILVQTSTRFKHLDRRQLKLYLVLPKKYEDLISQSQKAWMQINRITLTPDLYTVGRMVTGRDPQFEIVHIEDRTGRRMFERN